MAFLADSLYLHRANAGQTLPLFVNAAVSEFEQERGQDGQNCINRLSTRVNAEGMRSRDQMGEPKRPDPTTDFATFPTDFKLRAFNHTISP
jgi:hypothetical protein